MSIQLEPSEIQKLAKKAGVNQPILSVRVVGDRVELHLLGGTVVPVTNAPKQEGTPASTNQDSARVEPFSPQDVLRDMNVSRLKQVAAYLEMSGYSKLKKAELIQVIISSQHNDEIQEAIVNSAFR